MESKEATQETGKGLFAMEGVQNFFSSFVPHGCDPYLRQGNPGRMGFPAFFLGVCMEINRSASLPAPPPTENRNSPLWQAAEAMEANFLKEMLKNMRKTVQESPELENNRGYKLFQGMLDEQYAEKAAHTQGIGLAELIVKHVMEMQEGANRHANVPVRDLNKSDVIKK